MVELLLDTTFLLPLFGIPLDVRGFPDRFPRLLDSYTVLYNPGSVIEAKWVVLGLARRRPKERENLLRAYRRGLNVLSSEARLSQTSLTGAEVEARADDLLEAGVVDYFDRTLCATAALRGSTLLTEDEQLLGLASRIGPMAPTTTDWKQATSELR